jgi:hypothetical protein
MKQHAERAKVGEVDNFSPKVCPTSEPKPNLPCEHEIPPKPDISVSENFDPETLGTDSKGVSEGNVPFERRKSWIRMERASMHTLDKMSLVVIPVVFAVIFATHF